MPVGEGREREIRGLRAREEENVEELRSAVERKMEERTLRVAILGFGLFAKGDDGIRWGPWDLKDAKYRFLA